MSTKSPPSALHMSCSPKSSEGIHSSYIEDYNRVQTIAHIPFITDPEHLVVWRGGTIDWIAHNGETSSERPPGLRVIVFRG